MLEGNCSRHSDTPAIAKCEKCGAGMCLECIEEVEKLNTECTQNICLDCYKEELKEYIAKGYKTSGDLLSGLFKLLLFFGGIGLIVFGSLLVSSDNLLYIIPIVLGALIIIISSWICNPESFFAEDFDGIGDLLLQLLFHFFDSLIFFPFRSAKQVFEGAVELDKARKKYNSACEKLNKLDRDYDELNKSDNLYKEIWNG